MGEAFCVLDASWSFCRLDFQEAFLEVCANWGLVEVFQCCSLHLTFERWKCHFRRCLFQVFSDLLLSFEKSVDNEAFLQILYCSFARELLCDNHFVQRKFPLSRKKKTGSLIFCFLFTKILDLETTNLDLWNTSFCGINKNLNFGFSAV